MKESCHRIATHDDRARTATTLWTEGRSAAALSRLLQSPCEPLPPPVPSEGAGLHAFYYQGPFPAYQPIAAPDCAVPIYVGRAVPRGARRGEVGRLGDPHARLLVQAHARQPWWAAGTHRGCRGPWPGGPGPSA